MPPTSGWATRSKRFAAKTAPDKGAEAFVVVRFAARQKQFARHAQLAGPGKQRRLDKRPEARRRQQEKTFGKRVQLAAMDDINFLIGGLG